MADRSASWKNKLRDRLADRERDALRRELPGDGAAGMIDLGTNDYLGLSRHPRIVERVREAAAAGGVGAGASRVLLRGGEMQHACERAVVRFKRGTDSDDRGLLLSTGYAANLSVIGGLVQRGDLVLLDKLALVPVEALVGARLLDGALRLDREHTLVELDVDLVGAKAGQRSADDQRLGGLGDIERQIALVRVVRVHAELIVALVASLALRGGELEVAEVERSARRARNVEEEEQI